MTTPSISFLIFAHNEGKELDILLGKLIPWIKKNPSDEIVVVDDFSTEELTIEVLRMAANDGVKIVQHPLAGDFSKHKNFGNEQCTKDFILQIDADEEPTADFLENVRELITMNPTVELFWIPRINIVRGLTQKDLHKWGWFIQTCDELPLSEMTIDDNSDEYKLLKERNLIVLEENVD